MRFFLILVITLIPVSLAWSQPLTIGSTATNWSLQTKEDKTIDYYQDSEDKVSVILFWATWCPYCPSLMPHLEAVYRKYRNKGLKFYAIDIYEDGKIDPVELFERKEFSYTLLLQGDLVAEDYAIRGTPSLYVIDKDKKIIYKRPGGIDDALVAQNVGLKIKHAIAQ